MTDDSLIRAMASTLCDHDVDLHGDPVKMIEVLINAGFKAYDISLHWDAIITMAMIRQRNEEKRQCQ